MITKSDSTIETVFKIMLFVGLILYVIALSKGHHDKIASNKEEINSLKSQIEEMKIAEENRIIEERETAPVYLGYVYTFNYEVEYITANPGSPYKHYLVDNPNSHKKKIYTEYTAVTRKTSLQYKLLNQDLDGDGKPDRYTDTESGVRIVQDKNGVWRYCVAAGTYWANGEIGRLIDFITENGKVIPCVTCDVKQDIHTMGGQGKYGYVANDVIEFYTDPARKAVDSWNGLPLKYKAGDVSTAKELFEGAVTEVIVYDEYVEGFEEVH